MSKKKQPISLNWEDFQHLGNPDNAPEMEEESNEKDSKIPKNIAIRIYLDRKNRRGKSVSLIKGFEDFEDELIKPIAKKLKSLCGVGGNLKHGEIMIQGDNRDKILQYFLDEGYKNVKKAGG